MQSFVIEGGRPLHGRVRAAGNKNGALPILAASLLASSRSTLSNVPRIRDVETMVELLADVGAEVEWLGPNDVRVDARARRQVRARRGAVQPDPRLVPARRPAARALRARQRAAARRRRDRPPPRSTRTSTRFAELGAEVEIERPLRDARERAARSHRLPRRGERDGDRERRHGRRAARPGDTMIGNAACEPHVQDLCRFLVSLGARIDGDRLERAPDRGRRLARAAASSASAPITSRWRASSGSPR